MASRNQNQSRVAALIPSGIPAWAWAVLAFSVGLFLFGQVYFSERIGVWSEEVSTYPTGPGAAAGLGPDEELRFDRCGDEVRWRISDYRPQLALCAAGRTWPVMGASYYSTWMYWPLASVLPESVFALRKVGILFGLASLLMAFFVAVRLSDAPTAAAAVLAASVSSAFVVPHSLLVHFEIVQLPLAVLSALALGSVPRGEMLSRRRAAWVGFAAGLALAVNVKAVFLLFALALVLWRSGRLASLRGPAGPVAAVAAAVPLLPMVAFAAVDPRSGVSSQVVYRLDNIAARLSSGSAFAEPRNALRFWTDLASYGDQVAGLPDVAVSLLLVLPALALGRISLHFVQAMRRRDHDPLAASLGALVTVYIVVAALLWDQAPAANYAPLHVVFGVATGASAVSFGRWTASRLGASTRVGGALAGLLVVAAAAGFGYHTYRRGDPGRLAVSTNTTAQRALVAHLADAPGGTVVTASYNLAGVVDAVSGGRVRATRVEPYLAYCGDVGESELALCVRDHLGRLVAEMGRLRLVVPSHAALHDEAAAAHVGPALEALARRGELEFDHEASFSGEGTGPLLTLWDVRPR